MSSSFERQKRYDIRKAEYCKTHGINLECMKYMASANIDILEEIAIKFLTKYQYMNPLVKTEKKVEILHNRVSLCSHGKSQTAGGFRWELFISNDA